jgi:hypothetical protein
MVYFTTDGALSSSQKNIPEKWNLICAAEK